MSTQIAQAACNYGTYTRQDVDRLLNSFELTDGTNSVTVPVNQKGNGASLYYDCTDYALTTLPGVSLSFSALSWTGSWMHGYLFVDYDGDGEYNTVLNVDGTTGGELVSYTYYEASASKTGKNSLGQNVDYASGVSAEGMPAFTLPADLPAGDYKALFKVDWANLSPCGATSMGKDGGCAAEFTITIEDPAERTITVKSSDASKGSVSIEGTDALTITKSGAVVIKATPAVGYSFSKWVNEADNTTYSTLNPLTINNTEDLSLIGEFTNLTYPTMSRTFTGNLSQQNRYLKSVTTAGTLTPTVFNCATQADLPYTAFNVTPGTYTTSGATIDKTANPIVVEHGTRSFTITYHGWTEAIASNKAEINWVQEAYFVDWNGNGTFTDANEISDRGWTTVPYGDILGDGATRTVTIPANQPAGTYRMRVVFYEPANNSTEWQKTLFTTGANRIRNGISYDMLIKIETPSDMEIQSVASTTVTGKTSAGSKGVTLANVVFQTSGSINPKTIESIKATYTGTSTSDLKNLRWVYKTSTSTNGAPVGTALDAASDNLDFEINSALASGANTFSLLADVAEDAAEDDVISLTIDRIIVDGKDVEFTATDGNGLVVTTDIDYTVGNALWFDTPTSSTAGTAVWNTNDFSSTDTNPDQLWERKSFPMGNGSFGGNVLGGVSRERIVLNEKTLWKGGPGTGAAAYWDMNKTVSASTLEQIRNYLKNGSTYSANSLVQSNYAGKINYTKDKFGTYTTMGEVYVNTGINESGITDYKRIVNMDKSMIVVQFNSGAVSYRRKYFTSYPDNVMVWNFTSDGGAQNLTFSFSCPQTVTAVEAVDGGLLYKCKLASNNMEWAMRVYVRVNGAGTVTPNATSRNITISGATDVDFILAADTDYKMNFNPSTTDPAAFVGEDPVANVNEWIDAAKDRSFDDLYARHYEDYSNIYDRTSLEINPGTVYSNLPTPTRLANYRAGTLDHELEQMYFQYGRYLLISSSRAGNMPANLQGMWHNNIDGPWRVDYHNNINLQMNYWPATATNMLECFTPLIDYVRGLVEPGKRTAQSYYGARGWTAEVSTNIFGFTAPLNSTDMSWNYNPTAGPWLAAQIWEYYDYCRDKEWLREVGYDIIKGSADFCSDLLFLHNGTYTSAPSYSPEHGTVDLGATYANAVTREVLSAAIQAAKILDVDAESVTEWQEKLDNMYPYQVGRYGQLQEWYKDIDTYNDTHRHTNHLYGLHPGTSINAITDKTLVDACKETLRQRGDAATGWSMGWKLNHWARLLDGDHAYVLFRNLLKNGTADNMWDLHPPFQIDGNFGGTAGVAELFLQSHNGMLHLLPALPSDWHNGSVTGLLARGNFVVDVHYADNELDHALIHSNVGGPCKVYYDGKETTFDTEAGSDYEVRMKDGKLSVEGTVAIDDIEVAGEADNNLEIVANGDKGFTAVLSGSTTGVVTLTVYNVAGAAVKTVRANKTDAVVNVPLHIDAPAGCYIVKASGSNISAARKVIIR